MRTIRMFTGQELNLTCIGCAVSDLTASAYPGTMHVGPCFHVHQDIETPLPGFTIISTRRHIASVADFTIRELHDFSHTLLATRMALSDVGFTTVYMFQNEDTADHFHLWLFPVHPWMKDLGKGPTMLAEALRQVKSGIGISSPSEVINVARNIAASMERHLD